MRPKKMRNKISFLHHDTFRKIWTDNLPHDGVEVERGPRICATYYKAILDHMFPSTQFTQPVPDNNRYPDAKM